MAEKAKTARKDKKSDSPQICPTCGATSRVVQFAEIREKRVLLGV